MHGKKIDYSVRPLIKAMACAVFPSAIAILIAPWMADPELRKATYAGAVTLLFGGFLGGALKLLLDEVVAANRRRGDAAGFVTRVLGDLKGVYDRVARAKIVIPAHRSAKTYGEEMGGLIEARVQLRNVVRALTFRTDGVREKTREPVVRLVGDMETYLTSLTNEFRDKSRSLSDLERRCEAYTEVAVEAFAKGEGGEPPAISEFVWNSLCSLPALADLMNDGKNYTGQFERPLDCASRWLRDELAYIQNPRGIGHEAIDMPCPVGSAKRDSS